MPDKITIDDVTRVVQERDELRAELEVARQQIKELRQDLNIERASKAREALAVIDQRDKARAENERQRAALLAHHQGLVLGDCDRCGEPAPPNVYNDFKGS